ncbi:unnamed protein product [Soboliphyme baturini]|uniref:Radixin n=1 Tax=Soboliphyme baturini TaxID=241478 RepID=A0A183J7V3_9BILA|nr:unnamed protein product [Soboliphyme baturini]
MSISTFFRHQAYLDEAVASDPAKRERLRRLHSGELDYEALCESHGFVDLTRYLLEKFQVKVLKRYHEALSERTKELEAALPSLRKLFGLKPSFINERIKILEAKSEEALKEPHEDIDEMRQECLANQRMITELTKEREELSMQTIKRKFEEMMHTSDSMLGDEESQLTMKYVIQNEKMADFYTQLAPWTVEEFSRRAVTLRQWLFDVEFLLDENSAPGTYSFQDFRISAREGKKFVQMLICFSLYYNKEIVWFPSNTYEIEIGVTPFAKYYAG